MLSFYGYTIAIYVIGIMFAIAGISLGLGYALSERKLKEFGRKELLESVFNGIIIGSLFILFSNNGAISVVLNQLTLQNGTNISCSSFLEQNPAICLANNYLVGTTPYSFNGVYHSSVLTTVSTMIVGLVSLNTILGLIAAAKIDLLLVTISLSYVVSPLISQIQYVVRILSTVAISTIVQSSVLLFAAVSSLSIILPSGMILRSFYPTRKLGGFLMATAIGLYVVLPLSYVMNASLVSSFSNNVNATSLSQISLSASNFQGSIIGSGEQAQKSNYTDITGIINTMTIGITSISTSITNLINGLLGFVAYLIVYSFVLPIFSLIITGISIRELSQILGAEAFFGKFNIL